MITYSGPCWPHTVEHVSAERYAYDEVFRVSDAHDVSRFGLWEEACAGVDAAVVSQLDPRLRRREQHSAISIFGFPSRKAAYCNARRVPLDHLLAADFAKLQIKPALDDAEEILSVGLFVSCDAPIEPPYGSVRGFFYPLVVWRGCSYDVVQLHYYV